MPRPLRVLHCLGNVGGNPQGLAEAERALGLDSLAVALEPGIFEYHADEVLARPGDSLLAREFKRLGLVGRAMRDFDVIHFNFGRGITHLRYDPFSGARTSPRDRLDDLYAWALQLRELPLLKRAGKGIVVTFQGDDARQGDYSLANFEVSLAQEVGPGYYSPASDAGKRAVIRTWDRYADRIYALNPDLLHVLPARAGFMPYASVDPRAWQPVQADNAVPLVLHAPSHRGAKGTRMVLDAVARLQAEGVAFEFMLVENLPHAEARKLYERADLLIDQLLAGWYGALAVELMALGKPVICYLREGDLGFIPPAMREQLPLINASPTTIYDVLKAWLTTHRAGLAERGRQGRAFVEAWHDPRMIAAQLKEAYESLR